MGYKIKCGIINRGTMRRARTTIENNEITENLHHKISITLNEEKLFLVVDFMDGRFLIEKSFKNNHVGVNEMDRTMCKFETEEKVMQYLGINEGDL